MKVSTKLLVELERYLRLESIDKLSVFTTTIIVILVVFALGASALFFLCMSMVEALSMLIGNNAVAYLIVGVFLLFMLLIFLLNKKSWVEDRVVRRMSKSILNSPMLAGDESVLDEGYEDEDAESEIQEGGSGL